MITRCLRCGRTLVIVRETQKPSLNQWVCLVRKVPEDARSVPVELIVHVGPLDERHMPDFSTSSCNLDHKSAVAEQRRVHILAMKVVL